jgi:hypothetical protein
VGIVNGNICIMEEVSMIKKSPDKSEPVCGAMMGVWV